MEKIKNKLKSIQMKLFLTLCVVVIIIIVFLILTNNFVLESFYLYSKTKNLEDIYNKINSYYNQGNMDSESLKLELEKDAINHNFDILIISQNNVNIYSTNRDFLSNIHELNSMNQILQRDENIVFEDENVSIRKFEDMSNGLTFMMFTAYLDNGYQLYIRMPVASIHESVKISNHFLYMIGGVTIFVGGIVVSFISKRFTSPILELNHIAQRMSKLDFSYKYQENDTEDEINHLGKSINVMSEKLEKTIRQLRQTNIELEKDIEEKSKIDEMRKQFISDVSHELKTPISLIQGYSEGLLENVTTDAENRTFYAEVILDEANKMDQLVKQLLELMKLEYGKREFNNQPFDICELIQEVVHKSKVMLEETGMEVEMELKGPVYVNADNFYIEQVVTNYVTNAIKYSKPIEGSKKMQITIKQGQENQAVRICVFNTGEPIAEENLGRIWNRFYKIDESRNRGDGGSGIGLALVKAIMHHYQKDYGVENKENGVCFYFELPLAKEEKK